MKQLKNTKVLVILIGENTKNLYKYVRWEIEYAIENDIPIVAVNLNKSKKQVMKELRSKKIGTQVHYIPVHLQPYYKKLGWKKGDFPVAEDYYKKALSLPMFPTLTDKEQDYVIEKIKLFCKSL